MTFRTLSDSSDMRPILASTDLESGIQAIASAVYSRLNLFKGEWWEDRTLGFALPDFLIEGVRTVSDAQTLANYITAYIATTPGVTSVTDIQYTLAREMTYSCTVHSDKETTTITTNVSLP